MRLDGPGALVRGGRPVGVPLAERTGPSWVRAAGRLVAASQHTNLTLADVAEWFTGDAAAAPRGAENSPA